MATTTQVGRGVGSALGLFLGIREGDRRRKKRLKAKADLDEKELQEARDKELRAARLKIFLEGNLEPEQRETFLSTKGFTPIAGEDRDERLRKAAIIRRRQQLGLTKQPLAGLIAGGSVEEPGFVMAPGDIAGVGKTEAETGLITEKTETEKVSQDLKRADIRLRDAQAAKATADATEALQKDKGDKKSVEIKNLDKLVSTLNTELGRLTESDGSPIDDEFEERVNTLRARLQKTNEILSISKGLIKPIGSKSQKVQQTIAWFKEGKILSTASWERIIKENNLEKEAREFLRATR